MIKKFDSNGIAENIKRKFGKCLEQLDYEGAISNLIKYSVEKQDFSEFHLGLGMLFLMMTQDSDDVELLYLARREFYLQIIRQPKCRLAYRNLLATEFMRYPAPDLDVFKKWYEKAGMDVEEMIDEFYDEGLFLPYGESAEDGYEPMSFDEFFEEGEFGEIDPTFEPYMKRNPDGSDPDFYDDIEDFDSDYSGESEEMEVRNIVEAKNVARSEPPRKKIIAFNTGRIKQSSSVEPTPLKTKTLKFGSASDLDNDEIFKITDDGEVRTDAPEDLKRSFEEGLSLRLAQFSIESDKLDDALNLTEIIPPTSKFYYTACAVRGYVYLEKKDYPHALEELKKSLEIKPDGSLAGTIYCRYLEETGDIKAIPDALKAIDYTDFIDGGHVLKAFRFATEYCDENTALELINKYIEEYNMLQMRLVRAQIMYNRGEKEFAVKELEKLSDILYDDVSIKFFLLIAQQNEQKMPVGAEVPSYIVNNMVEEIISFTEKNEIGDGIENDPYITTELDFFMCLIFRNKPAYMRRMFAALNKFSFCSALGAYMRDKLVSPFIEPVVKAAVFSGVYANAPQAPFLIEVDSVPVSSECLKRPPKTSPRGVNIAYAYVTVLAREKIPDFLSEARKMRTQLARIPERECAYYLVKNALRGTRYEKESRIAYSLGFTSKADADGAIEAWALNNPTR